MADFKLRLQFLEGKQHENEELKITTKNVLTYQLVDTRDWKTTTMDVLTQRMSHNQLLSEEIPRLVRQFLGNIVGAGFK